MQFAAHIFFLVWFASPEKSGYEADSTKHLFLTSMGIWFGGKEQVTG